MAGSKKLRMGAMLERVDEVFGAARDVPRRGASLKHTLRDVLMAGLAVFVFKAPSLLQFERRWRGEGTRFDNLRRLFGIERVPSDETLRQRLDAVEPTFLGRAFRVLFAVAQRARMLRHFQLEDGGYLLAVDGTGLYTSKAIACATCCVRRRRSGEEYYHYMVQGALVHPDHRQALMPSGPEFVCKEDGADKNDCEQRALQRYLMRFRREHPHLKVTVVLDGLFPNTPTVLLLLRLNLHFVIVAKRGSCPQPFADFESYRRGAFDDPDVAGRRIGRTVEYARRVRLTQARDAPRLTMVRTWEPARRRSRRDPPGVSKWAFLSDRPLPDGDAAASRALASLIAILGRTRWKIENHVFKTLKEQSGCNMKHNYGHGRRHLWQALTLLMLVAFQLDQLQTLGSSVFQAALRREDGRPSYLWRSMHSHLLAVPLRDWDMLFGLIGEPERWAVAVMPSPAGADPPAP